MQTAIKKRVLLIILCVLQLAFRARAAVDIGQVQSSTIGHHFSKFGPLGRPNIVSDFLVDQDQSSGGGGVTKSFSANFDTNNQFVLTIAAPPGQKFLVQPPTGEAVRFLASMNWQGPYVLSNGPSYFGTVAVTFGGLEGEAPDFSSSRSVLSELHGFVGFNDIRSIAFSNVLAFTSITLTATVPSTNVGSGNWVYSPTRDNAFALSYRTSETNDPGRFVSIVPELPAAPLQPEVLYSFTGGQANPTASLVEGRDGSFYGVTSFGGDGRGNIFKVTRNGTFTTLATFNFDNGEHPTTGLTLGSDGNFYGTTGQGGVSGYGTIFKVTPSGTLTTLVNFDESNGAFPATVLTPGSDGNFYGTTVTGANYYGTVFKLAPDGTFTTLLNFPAHYSSFPGGLTLGRDGNLYGTTYNGANAIGAVFRVTTNGALTTLAALPGSSRPCATSLTLGNNGNLYGTTIEGGRGHHGTVFRVTTHGTLTTLVNFNFNNGSGPADGLTLGDDGNFYGTTANGGNGENGTVFKMTPDGTLTTLVHFTNASGAHPYAALTLGSEGSLYGTTYSGGSRGIGVIFRVDLPPGIISQPASRTNGAGTTATFTVTATGTHPLIYRWLKDGANIVEGGDVSGASSPTLSLANVQFDDGGKFAVVVSNNSGSVTSSVAVLTVQASSDSTALLTFDALPLGADWSVIQNGYGRLLWDNFGAFNGSTRPETEGYRTGVVSSPNVAFNLFGNAASISSASAFDLKSTYLTAAFVNGLQIEVQGFVGATLTYDNSYCINTTGPTLIHFNYMGVDQVRFIPFPGSQFVMDNLTVTIPVCASVAVVEVQTNGPGPIVTVVPGTQPIVNQSTVVQPTVNVTLQPNGDATVRFTGSLQSASDLNGTFEDVPGSSQGSYTIPRERLTPRQYFRAKGN